MANTYTQIYLQLVFAVQNRISLIQDEWKDELYKYITGIIKNQDHKLIAINGMPDHLHILLGYNPNQKIPDMLQDIKGSSSTWINDKGFFKGKFNWQTGYGAFSYSRSQINNVVNYINNQQQHHKNQTFHQEYLQFLKLFDISFDEQYIFQDIK